MVYQLEPGSKPCLGHMCESLKLEYEEYMRIDSTIDQSAKFFHRTRATLHKVDSSVPQFFR